MSALLEFVALGDQTIPGVPLRCVPLALPTAGALYRRRIEAVMSSTADYVCFVDGNEDVLLPGFVAAMQALADAGQPLGYAAEMVHGKPRECPTFSPRGFMLDHSIIHHGVVCSVAALRAIDWPAGCYCWEGIAYGTLAAQGLTFDPVPRYDWRPGPKGARLWADFPRAVVNSKLWLQGRSGVHFKRDF